jgi:hypothetical protein
MKIILRSKRTNVLWSTIDGTEVVNLSTMEVHAITPEKLKESFIINLKLTDMCDKNPTLIELIGKVNLEVE